MNSKIPSAKEIKALYDYYKTPIGVQNHCRAVAYVADMIAKAYDDASISINIEQIHAAAMLHDFMRAKPQHAIVASKILKNKGYIDTATIVLHHDFRYIKQKLLKGYEEQIVSYADKRVIHNQIVSINERIDDLKIRYSAKAKLIESFRKPTLELEGKIFSKLDLKPNFLQNS